MRLFREDEISTKKFFASLLLYASTFASFFFFFAHFGQIFSAFEQSNSVFLIVSQVVFLSLVVVFAVTGSLIAEKFDRRKLLFYLVLFGTVSTALLLFFQGFFPSLLLGAFVGVSFGLCFPVVNAYVSDSTAVEVRARVFGIAILVSFLIVVLADVIVNNWVLGVLLFAVALRAIGFSTLAIDSCQRKTSQLKSSWRKIFSFRSFLFYLFPWLIFNIANGLYSFVNIPQTEEYLWASDVGAGLHFVAAGIFALIGGVIADKRGRKQPILVGMVLLGVSYALLGLIPSWQSLIVYLTLSGVSWGLIMVVYFAVFGDLAFPEAQERFYALGVVVPFILFTSFSSFSQLIAFHPSMTSLSPILSIVLFFSVVPLFFVPETLPESKIKERKLKNHIQKVEELVQESKKGAKK
jgi:MFS family permease